MSPAQTLRVDLKGDREIVITRDFAAPRTLVFDAMTKPELLFRWFSGPPGWTLQKCEVDLRVGGKLRYEWVKSTANKLLGMGGEFREIAPPERIVHTETFDDPWYKGEATNTLVLTEAVPGTTTMTITIEYESREVRDGILKSGMEQGMAYAYDKLAALLPELQA